MSSNQTTSNVILPSFTGPIEPTFVAHFVNHVLDTQLPTNGSWADNHLTDWGDETKMFIPLSEALYKMSTDGLPAKDRADSIAMTSVRMLTHLPQIIEELAVKMPARLDCINWRLKQLDFSAYNEKQFRGKDRETGQPMYGAAAFMLVAHLSPMPGKVTICKNRAPTSKAPADEGEGEGEGESKAKPKEEKDENETKAKAKVKKPFTAQYTQAPAAGGGGPHTGRKPRN